MLVLDRLIDALSEGAVEVIDLTAPLCEQTPVIELPPELGQPWHFERELISRYDAAGPHVYWNNIKMSEHTGTHFDAPVHWLPGRDLDDISAIPLQRLVAPAVVLDFSREATADPDFLLTVEHVAAWQRDHGPFPAGGWVLFRTGWDTRGSDPKTFLNYGHTPGLTPECARFLAEETPLIGIGVETVGTDAGGAGQFVPEYPCHHYFQGANKYGLTQLRNLRSLPTRGAVLVTGPLPISGGSGSPARVLALVDRAGAVTR
jgi:kynurenine formamidase